ncbi:hypothetical protein TNCV_445911 [Trichonephila clavipes]|nr:hypothetical protein TNCV_445911 [Trichonephila clavipes]
MIEICHCMNKCIIILDKSLSGRKQSLHHRMDTPVILPFRTTIGPDNHSSTLVQVSTLPVAGKRVKDDSLDHITFFYLVSTRLFGCDTPVDEGCTTAQHSITSDKDSFVTKSVDFVYVGGMKATSTFTPNEDWTRITLPGESQLTTGNNTHLILVVFTTDVFGSTKTGLQVECSQKTQTIGR